MVPGYDDAFTLDSVLFSVRERIARLGTADGQQLAGVAPPRPGHPASDGIRFTAETCERVYRHLRANRVVCVRVFVDGHPGALSYSIVFSATPERLRQMLERGRKSVSRASFTARRLTFTVLDDPDAPLAQ